MTPDQEFSTRRAILDTLRAKGELRLKPEELEQLLLVHQMESEGQLEIVSRERGLIICQPPAKKEGA